MKYLDPLLLEMDKIIWPWWWSNQGYRIYQVRYLHTHLKIIISRWQALCVERWNVYFCVPYQLWGASSVADSCRNAILRSGVKTLLIFRWLKVGWSWLRYFAHIDVSVHDSIVQKPKAIQRWHSSLVLIGWLGNLRLFPNFFAPQLFY